MDCFISSCRVISSHYKTHLTNFCYLDLLEFNYGLLCCRGEGCLSHIGCVLRCLHASTARGRVCALVLGRSVCDSCGPRPFSRPSVEEHVRQTHARGRIRKRGLLPAAQGPVKLHWHIYCDSICISLSCGLLFLK